MPRRAVSASAKSESRLTVRHLRLSLLVLLLLVPLPLLAAATASGASPPAAPSPPQSRPRGVNDDGAAADETSASRGGTTGDSARLGLRQPERNETRWAAANGSEGAQLQLPVLWMAPFLSGGGYCSEAIEFVAALAGEAEGRRAEGGGEGEEGGEWGSKEEGGPSCRRAEEGAGKGAGEAGEGRQAAVAGGECSSSSSSSEQRQPPQCAAAPLPPPPEQSVPPPPFLPPRHLRIAQHGDGISWDFIRGLPEGRARLLQRLLEGDCCGRQELGGGGEGGGGGQGQGEGEGEGGRAIAWASGLVVCHSEPGAWRPSLFATAPCPPDEEGEEEGTGGPAPYVVGRTMFETDRVEEEHVRRCNRMDEVWVPSSFHLASFSASGVAPSKLRLVPQAVDTNLFSPHAARRLPLPEADLAVGPDVLSESNGLTWQWNDDETGGTPRDPPPAAEAAPPPSAASPSPLPFVFLSVFKWERRKGWDLLLRAYLLEFSAADGVALFLHTSAFHAPPGFSFPSAIRSFIAEQGLLPPPSGFPPVYVHSQSLPAAALPALYRAAGAFVLPSRGEGWGRPVGEAMAMALPVVTTNWSGLTELVEEERGYPVAVAALEEVGEGPFRRHRWARPDEGHLRRRMREVWRERGEARERGRRAREFVAARFSPRVVAEAVMRRMREIEKIVWERRRGQSEDAM